MADQLCTTAQVKARLQNAATGVVFSVTDTTMIGELIDEVSDWIEHYTGRKLVPDNAATYVFDTVAGYVLRVPMGIRSITSMGINVLVHQPDTGGTYVTLSAATLLLRPRSGDLPFGWPPTEIHLSRATSSVFATVENGATVTGNFGWAATPPDIQAVCIDAVVAAFQSRKNGASSALGVEDSALPPWSGFFGRGSPQRGTLDRYKSWAIA
jgi:hypothetical protein